MITYTRTITDAEQKILEHDLLDIKDWIDKAIQGKINNCAKRFIVAQQTANYKNRVERENETSTNL